METLGQLPVFLLHHHRDHWSSSLFSAESIPALRKIGETAVNEYPFSRKQDGADRIFQ